MHHTLQEQMAFTRDDPIGVFLLNAEPEKAATQRGYFPSEAASTAETIASPGPRYSMVTLAAFDTITAEKEVSLYAHTGHF